MKIKAILYSILMMIPQGLIAEVNTHQMMISQFDRALSVSGMPLDMKLPRNVVFQKDVSNVSLESGDHSTLVFESNSTYQNRITYKLSDVTEGLKSEHISQVECELNEKYSGVKQSNKRIKYEQGETGRYKMEMVTFSYSDGGQPTSVSVVSYSDSKRVASVIVESPHKTMGKAQKVSKRLASQALSVHQEGSDYSIGMYCLGAIGVVAIAYILVPLCFVIALCCNSGGKLRF